MIGTSLPELLFIRLCIFASQHAPYLIAAGLLFSLTFRGWSSLPTQLLACLLAAEAIFVVTLYLPLGKRLVRDASHPPALGRAERRKLFERCVTNIPDVERYLRLWILGAAAEDIREENVREFLRWAFFDAAEGQCGEEIDGQGGEELQELIERFEALLGRKFQPGRGKAQCLRLTLDRVHVRYRSLLWYVVIAVVDLATHSLLASSRFQYHAQPMSKLLAVFPPRIQQVCSTRRSPAASLSYWYKPHTAVGKLPVVFLHGIGVGLWTYTTFLTELNDSLEPTSQIGILAIELLPISFRITHDPLSRPEFLRQFTKILDFHGWQKVVLVSHSYGSVLTTHLLRSPAMQARIESLVLIDPVSLLLHLPDIAYNFTRRMPHAANEWQLWYFASMDPCVALTLGRHFFWRENAIWKEDLLATGGAEDAIHRRRVAVCLSGRDIIVDTAAVARYLTDDSWVDTPSGVGPRPGNREAGVHKSGEGRDASEREGDPNHIQLLWFPGLDHSQAFDSHNDRQRILSVIRSYCAES